MRNRAWAVSACALVIMAVLLLAPALGHLRFEPAKKLAWGSAATMPAFLSELHIDESTSVGEILAFWLAIVLPVALALFLLPPEMRKRLLQQLIRLALFALALVLALRYRLIHLPELEGAVLDPSAGGFQTPAGPSQGDAFTPPVIPPWLMYLISFLFTALLAWGLYQLYRVWERARERRGSGLDAIAVAARDSLRDLAEGRQWGDVVLEAYARMTDAVRLARGLQRETAWTPREFAAHLAHKGLPRVAVDDLTRLFEAARYGGTTADANARHRAASCLESILQACRMAP
ncbi:MAG TPA: DUF4129 domain-containing protein [Anaerolineales bacterium]|nr:DUF4129 domain-containing protein [Anaerolineales bacterium]